MNLNEKIWRGGLANTEGFRQVIPNIEAVAEEFFIPDNINPLCFAANFQALLVQAGASRPAPGAPEATPTASIQPFIKADARPPGFPLWFIAAYPDICLWLQSMEADREKFWLELIMQTFGSDITEGFQAQDEKGHVRKELLRQLIEQYTEKKPVLECRCKEDMLATKEKPGKKPRPSEPSPSKTAGKAGPKTGPMLLWAAAIALLLTLIVLILR